MRYKVGDKVRIIGNIHSHGFDRGDIVEITEMYEDEESNVQYLADDTFYVCDDELEDVDVKIYSPETTAMIEMFMKAHSGKLSDYSRIEWPTAFNIAKIYVEGLLNMYSGDSDYGVNELEEILEELNK